MYDTSHTYCTFYNETPILAYIWFTTHTSRDVFYLTPLNVADKFDTLGFDTFTTYIPSRAIMRSRSTSIYPKKYQTYEIALWFLKARYAVIMQLLDITIIITITIINIIITLIVVKVVLLSLSPLSTAPSEAMPTTASTSSYLPRPSVHIQICTQGIVKKKQYSLYRTKFIKYHLNL